MCDTPCPRNRSIMCQRCQRFNTLIEVSIALMQVNTEQNEEEKAHKTSVRQL